MTDTIDLVIFEMANNHQGSVEHAIDIVNTYAALAKERGLRAAVKLQYRDLDTFIHPDHRHDKEHKHIGRFLSTELSAEQFKQIVDAIHAAGLVSVVTPFDEASVATIVEHGVGIIKVASASAGDWPLLTAIAGAGKPVIASTGGLRIEGVDAVVSFFQHRHVDLSVLHCVGVYPTDPQMQNLRNIDRFIKRYPGVPIGYSGHENPDDVLVGALAVACGARILERHVGIPFEGNPLNKYSMNPEQTAAWLDALVHARTLLGDRERQVSEAEAASLLSLSRGVFTRRPVRKGERLTPESVYFAMPCTDGQLTSGAFGRMRTTYTASRDYAPNEAVFESADEDEFHEIRRIINQAKGMLAEAQIPISPDTKAELSHHFGLERFADYGCILLTMVNREYAKKVLLVMPGQQNPEHRHLKKEETFHILTGTLDMTLNGVPMRLKRGDTLTVERGALHSFGSTDGCVFEEVSTTHARGDSYYTDPAISAQDPISRKTILESLN